MQSKHFSTIRRSGTILAACLTALTLTAAPSPATAAPHRLALIWADDFDQPAGTPPDPANWNHDTGGEGWGNEELQYYTNSTRNAAHDGAGNLAITAHKEQVADSNCWYGTCEYSSARLTTKNKFTQAYGRFEIRLKLPSGQGMWPAFWMLGSDYEEAGWPNCGEIDVMENVGNEPRTVYGTLHGPGFFDENGLAGETTNPSGMPLSADFHTFAVDWTPERITWSLDGNTYHSRTEADVPSGGRWVFDHPFFLLLNLAVGGTWPGSPDDTTQFPQQLIVDYIHVYQ
ncbi:family 16 glycosylhydrolase [Amycolatopsis sp. lyj-90]|uniref:glycoside hydrolase family 16 protein n=1 Tax=Amycolatopsis sp. lyj-90 TaxID=2789285 RepID=UPI00397D5135